MQNFNKSIKLSRCDISKGFIILDDSELRLKSYVKKSKHSTILYDQRVDEIRRERIVYSLYNVTYESKSSKYRDYPRIIATDSRPWISDDDEYSEYTASNIKVDRVIKRCCDNVESDDDEIFDDAVTTIGDKDSDDRVTVDGTPIIRVYRYLPRSRVRKHKDLRPLYVSGQYRDWVRYQVHPTPEYLRIHTELS